MSKIFLGFVVTVTLYLIVLAYLQYRRTDRSEIFHFDLDQLELTGAFAWGAMSMIFTGLVLHYCFMWPFDSIKFAIAMGVSFFLGMIIPII